MTAIAASSVAFGGDREFAPLWRAPARIGDTGGAAPSHQAPDHGDRVEAVASPWRAPCFYLAFVAGAVLMVAVGVIFAWRAIVRRGRSGVRSTAATVRQGRIATPAKHR